MADLNIYLIVKYVIRPKNPKLTAQKGYMKDPANLNYDEEVVVARGIKKRDLQYSQIILNLTEQLVERNTFKSETTFNELFEYFHEGYAEYIDQSVNSLNQTI
jgi:hypothetical protein